MKRKVFLFLLFFLICFFVYDLISLKLLASKVEKERLSSVNKQTPIPTPALTLYTNKKFGFSLNYPTHWSPPLEEKISPDQQHLYQITLNPTGQSYTVNLYLQPPIVSLSNFVRDYFKDVEGGVSWLDEAETNGRSVVKFFIPKSGLESRGIGAFALRKGEMIITISTPALRGQKEEIVGDKNLNMIAESFRWTK